MKQLKRVLPLFLMAMCLLLLNQTHAYAAKTDPKVLKVGKTYNLDLNGDSTKEKVKITSIADEDKGTTFIRIFIDGKRVLNKEYRTIYCSPYVYCADLNTKDTYRELVITVNVVDVYMDDLFVVRYKGDGKIKKFLLDESCERGLMIYGKSMGPETFVENTGKNSFFMCEWTPFKNRNFGCYVVKTEFKLKDGKLIKVDSDTREVVQEMFPLEKYQLAEEITLYSSSTTKSKKVATLKKGTKLLATEIKRGKGNPDKGYNLFIKIKTTKGKTGWIYCLKNNKKSFLKTVPTAM